MLPWYKNKYNKYYINITIACTNTDQYIQFRAREPVYYVALSV